MTNQCLLTGLVARVPETRKTKGGSVSAFRLAVSESRKHHKTGVWETLHTSFIPITCFGELGKRVVSLELGKRVTIMGRLKASTYQDQRGIVRHGFEVVALEVTEVHAVGIDGKAEWENVAEKIEETSNQEVGI
jgi:single-stranded DNA-binding protein